MKAVIIVKWYPPDNHIAGRRWGNLVSQLVASGVQCTVLTAGGNRTEGAARLVGAFGETVVRLPIPNAVYAPEAKGEAPRTIRSIVSRLATYLTPPVLRGYRSNRWHARVLPDALIEEACLGVDVVITSFPPLGPLLLGRHLARRHRAKWLVDLRDSFEVFDASSFPLSKWISRRLEAGLLRTADARITVGRKLVSYMSSLYGTPFSAVYNGWIESDRGTEDAPPAAGKPYVYYAGTFYEHSAAGLRFIAKALESRPEVVLKMRVLRDKSGGLLGEILSALSSAGRVELLPAAPAEVVRIETANALATLVLENLDDKRPLQLGTVTGKLIGLLVSGTPGIAVCQPNSEIRDLVEKAGGWYYAATQEECDEAFKAILDGPPRTDNSIPLEELHMTRQADNLKDIMKDILR